MAEISDAEWSAAEERGRIEMATKPRARSALYDVASQRLIVELVNGSTFIFPPRLAQGLENATDAQLSRVEILGVGFGLHWEELDADVSVEGLLAGRFGSRRYMAERFGSGWEAAAAE
ncbi:DUF2442 domain-containing protein [Sphingomonas sp.]|jgi:hypothetical protein|uniref:DUF2442 domain-containing protein n=1 Tax=Sphingomonas sp. TaxID=28214 RepID=UPI002ED9AD06